MEITCLLSHVDSGGISYPIFVGFCNARELDAISDAPAFDTSDTNESLASAVSNQPPTQKWQRPLDLDRVDAISRSFDGHGHLMPNPVLLAEAPGSRSVTVTPLVPKNSVYRIKIIDTKTSAKPLWILDGQHRIRGMAESGQADNDLPIVLLLNYPEDSSAVYHESIFAELFSQITTTARDLDEVHREWLSYRFHLNDYSETVSTCDAAERAMETTIKLCSLRTTALTSRIPNPWYDKICFNPIRKQKQSTRTAFYFNCNELRPIIQKRYYESAATILTPDEVALQLMEARVALDKVLADPKKSVFLGDKSHSQRAMQVGFVEAALTRLVHFGVTNWYELLTELRFSETDWDYSRWAKTDGTLGTYSKNVARRALTEVFLSSEIPSGAQDITDYLRGKGTTIIFNSDGTTANGKRIRRSADARQTCAAPSAQKKADKPFTIHLKDTTSNGAQHTLVSIDSSWKQKSNIAHLAVTPSGGTGDLSKLEGVTGTRGLRLSDLGPTGTVQFVVTCHHYGGKQSFANIEIQW